VIIDGALPGWQELLDRYDVNLLIVVSGERPQLTAIQASPVWCEQYQDRQALIFSRCPKP